MRFIAAVLGLVGFSCATAPLHDTVPKREVAQAEAIHFVLLATNDWHGQLFATKPEEGALPQGGVLAFSSMLSALREAFPERTIWVDAGNMLGEEWASPQQGQLLVDAFSLLGLEFATLGNGEFDLGPLEEEAQGALKAHLLRAKFPWSSANVYLKATGNHPAWLGTGLHMLERQGVHLGFIGLTTPNTPQYSHASNLRGLYFGDMAWAAEQGALALREKGAELVILAIHAPGTCAHGDKPEALPAEALPTEALPTEALPTEALPPCNLEEGEIWPLLEALPEGLVDVAITGHTLQPLGHFYKGVPVVQTRGMGKSFALVHLYWEPKARRLLRERTRIEVEVPICEKIWPSSQNCKGPPKEGEVAVPSMFLGKAGRVDAKLEALLRPFEGNARERRAESLGVEVGERLSMHGEEASALGGMWAESVLLASKADVALLSREVFRADLEAGMLSAGKLYESMPYGSRLALVRFSGEELRRLMQAALGQTRFRFDVAGVELRLSCFPSGRRRVKTQLVSAEGKKREIEDKAFYWVAMPEFLAQGGGGLEGVLDTGPRQTTLKKDFREEVLHFWQQRKQALLAPHKPKILWEGMLNSCHNGG